jgi:hypothetical protein
MLSSEVNKVFARFDVDGSGFLSRDRFKSAYVKFCGRYQSALAPSPLLLRYGQPHKVHVYIQFESAYHGEIMTRLLSDKEMDTLWSVCDSNGDGQIDSDEFEHLVRFRLKVPCLETCRTCNLQVITDALLCFV